MGSNYGGVRWDSARLDLKSEATMETKDDLAKFYGIGLTRGMELMDLMVNFYLEEHDDWRLLSLEEKKAELLKIQGKHVKKLLKLKGKEREFIVAYLVKGFATAVKKGLEEAKLRRMLYDEYERP